MSDATFTDRKELRDQIKHQYNSMNQYFFVQGNVLNKPHFGQNDQWRLPTQLRTKD